MQQRYSGHRPYVVKARRPSTKMPVFIAAGPTGLKRDDHTWMPSWDAVLAAGDVILVHDLVGTVRIEGHEDFESPRAWIDGIGPLANAWPVRRLEDEDVLTEQEVIAALREAISESTAASWARSAGVAKATVSHLLKGNVRPGGGVLRALDLLRLDGTDLYVRRQTWMLGWAGENRGGAGGTKPMPGGKFIQSCVEVYEALDEAGELA